MSIQVQCHNQVDLKTWDEWATRLGGGFYHCHAATIYTSRLLGAEPLFISAVDEGGQCVGIAAGTVASSRIWPFSRYCRMASFESTPVAGGDERMENEFLQAIEKHLCRHGVFRIGFASYHSPNSDHLLPGQAYTLTRRCEYDFDLTRSMDDLFGAFCSQRRNQVRRAEKRGVTVQEANSAEAANIVRHFHDLSMERRGIPAGPLKSSVVAARHELVASGRVQILVSYLNGEAVGADLFGVFNGLVYGLESGSSDLGNRNCSPTHLTWAAIQLFKEQGATCLSLGGAKEHEDGLRKFKQEFGTIETSQPMGYKIVSNFGGGLDALRKRLRRKGWTHGARGHKLSGRLSDTTGTGEEPPGAI